MARNSGDRNCCGLGRGTELDQFITSPGFARRTKMRSTNTRLRPNHASRRRWSPQRSAKSSGGRPASRTSLSVQSHEGFVEEENSGRLSRNGQWRPSFHPPKVGCRPREFRKAYHFQPFPCFRLRFEQFDAFDFQTEHHVFTVSQGTRCNPGRPYPDRRLTMHFLPSTELSGRSQARRESV